MTGAGTSASTTRLRAIRSGSTSSTPTWPRTASTSRRRRVCLVGHSHIALYFTRVDELSRITSELAPEQTSLSLAKGQWLLNPGSVGQPRDGDARAAWLELDTETQKTCWRRVEYPVHLAAEAIMEAGLPPHLADRLYQGH